MPKQETPRIKILVIGDKEVGKSALINRYLHDEYIENLRGNPLIDFEFKNEIIKSETLSLVIIEINGNVTTAPMTENRYKGKDVVLICFDLTKTISVESLESKIAHIQKFYLLEELPEIFLVGTKLDEKKLSEKELEDVRKFADANDYWLFETSAKNGSNVNSIFKKIANLGSNDQIDQKNNNKPQQQRICRLV